MIIISHYWSSRFHEKFNTNDLGNVKFMLGLEEYILKIIDCFGSLRCLGLKLTYYRMEDASAPLMYGRSDADWDVDERRTVIGHFIMLSGAAIFWSTRF